jgi:two-component system response regulator AtoC
MVSTDLLDPTVTENLRSTSVLASPRADTPRKFLLLVSHAGASQIFALEPSGDIVFGREPGVVVQLDEKQVSRRHARVYREAEAVFLEDLGSRNGTTLNGVRIRRKERLGSGDRIQIGSAEAVLAVMRSSPERPPATEAAAQQGSSFTPESIVVADREMRRVFSVAQRLGQTATTVLVLGETGTGKEVVARAIHEAGPRRERPFIQLNCAATPEGLLESELFGFERGAFTGAERAKAGLVEAANGGTLFLDEIGELPPSLQAKLLKFLQDRVTCRLGSVKPIALDVRVIAATHRPLDQEAATGVFRQDLYYRLAGFTLKVPPLRERPSEVLLLSQLFLRSLCEQEGRSLPHFGSDVTAALLQYGWPGNVRELRTAISHALVLADDTLRREHLPAAIAGGLPDVAATPASQLNRHLHAVQLAALQQVLGEESGNRTRAARRLGISRRALIYKIEKFGL